MQVTKVPRASDAATQARMNSQLRQNTKCELLVRRLLHREGLRYRIDCRPDVTLNRRADIVFTKARVAVFIDGCFWHRCPIHWRPPKRNAGWWTNKADSVARRDAETTASLNAAGWHVIRVWEHEDPGTAARAISLAVRGWGCAQR
jgi:DNA mismatch endonuclease, patch repair protein